MTMQRTLIRRLAGVGLSILVACLAGCGTLVTYYASWGSNNGVNADEKQVPPLDADPFLVDMTRKFGVFALFAGVVYRDDYPETERDGSGCNYLQPGVAIARLEFGMPRDLVGGEKIARWKRWIPDQADNVVACFDDKGLYYETYVLQDGGGDLLAAVIAFRGTENRAGQYVPDWGSNLAAALGFEPKQYALARDRVPALAKTLASRLKRNARGSVDLFAVGHSLGGGLAQQPATWPRKSLR